MMGRVLRYLRKTRFPAGGRSGNNAVGPFLRHLPCRDKGRSLLGYDLSWETKAAEQGAKGFSRVGDRAGAPKLAVPRSLPLEMLG